jgi:hypothetical protein
MIFILFRPTVQLSVWLTIFYFSNGNRSIMQSIFAKMFPSAKSDSDILELPSPRLITKLLIASIPC